MTIARQVLGTDLLEEYCTRYNNWGRWGDDDEVGTLNFITPEKIIESASMVRTGKVFSLELPLDGNGPQTGALARNRRCISNPRTSTLLCRRSLARQSGRQAAQARHRYPSGSSRRTGPETAGSRPARRSARTNRERAMRQPAMARESRRRHLVNAGRAPSVSLPQ